jgi:hypothetical protein
MIDAAKDRKKKERGQWFWDERKKKGPTSSEGVGPSPIVPTTRRKMKKTSQSPPARLLPQAVGRVRLQASI